MSHVLDQVIAGETPQTSYAHALRLPRPHAWEPGRVTTRWEVDPELMTPWGAIFGGYLAALADECAGLAALSVLEPGETFATNDLRLSPMRAVRGGPVTIEASVLHRGRSTIHVEVEFRDPGGTLLAKASALQLVRATERA
jgi:uncharacterized protein (TIGR00369 family)